MSPNRHIIRKPLPPSEDLRPVPSRQSEQRRLAHREERLHRFEQAKALRRQGLKIGEVASRLGVSRRTVERFLARGSFTDKQSRLRWLWRRSLVADGLMCGTVRRGFCLNVWCEFVAQADYGYLFTATTPCGCRSTGRELGDKIRKGYRRENIQRYHHLVIDTCCFLGGL